MLTRQQGLDPHALAAALDEVTVLEAITRQVDVLAADVADHHADVADRNLRERDQLDRDEPRVQVPRAREQHVLLQAATTARVDERLAALEAVVPAHDWTCQVAGRNRSPVECGHDTDAISG